MIIAVLIIIGGNLTLQLFQNVGLLMYDEYFSNKSSNGKGNICQLTSKYVILWISKFIYTAVAPRLQTVTNKPYVNEVILNEQN